MKKAAPILAAIGLSMCLCLPLRKASTAGQDASIGNSSFASSIIPGLGTVTADVNDSDEFFQNALRSRGHGRDYSQKIEALLKQMTVEEKVGQMTQLTLAMIVNGHDQNIEIDPSKLQKAIGKYGVGSILNVYDQALKPDRWQDIITQIQNAAKKTRLGINPSGKLPFTYPRAVDALVTYDHRAFETEGEHSASRPQFEFGYGLSYTSFGYSDLRLSKKTISGNEELSVSVTVSNTGRRAGKEVAQ